MKRTGLAIVLFMGVLGLAATVFTGDERAKGAATPPPAPEAQKEGGDTQGGVKGMGASQVAYSQATPGHIAKFCSRTTICDSIIYEGKGKKIGIGTTNPQAPVEVSTGGAGAQGSIQLDPGVYDAKFVAAITVKEGRKKNTLSLSAYDEDWGNLIGTWEDDSYGPSQGLGIMGGSWMAPFERFVVNTDEMFLGYSLRPGDGAAAGGGDGLGNLYVNGKVGIGTIDPKDRLEVAGSIRIDSGYQDAPVDGPRLIWRGGIVYGGDPPDGGVDRQEYRARVYTDGHLGFFPGESKPTTLALTQDGKVGIGTTEPSAELDIESPTGQCTLRLRGPGNGTGAAEIQLCDASYDSFWIIHRRDDSAAPPQQDRLIFSFKDCPFCPWRQALDLRPDGRVSNSEGAIWNGVTVGTDPDPDSYLFEHVFPYETIGLNNPGHNLRLTSPGAILFHPGGSDPFSTGVNESKQVVITDDGNVAIGEKTSDAKLTIAKPDSGGKTVLLRGYVGDDIVVEIGKGLDYSETFPTSHERPAPGTVMVIDPTNPGKLTISSAAYDTKVAGIIAGANGLDTGVRLGAQVDGADAHAVALAGRVYCNVDTRYGDIKPGDLLTTSPTPGHAMVVKDFSKAQGAILGKAMEKVSGTGKGRILVLVTLQ